MNRKAGHKIHKTLRSTFTRTPIYKIILTCHFYKLYFFSPILCIWEVPHNMQHLNCLLHQQKEPLKQCVCAAMIKEVPTFPL